MTFNNQTKFFISPEVVFQEIDGETILLDMNGEQYFGLNEVGTRVWQLLQEPSSLETLFSIMIKEYDVTEEELRKDLGDILSQLITAGLLEKDKTHSND
ncbi:MAG: PqqD family protein [Bacteroidetes bacterium]|nr:PqqD family protein [Bacteroidota bacterium]